LFNPLNESVNIKAIPITAINKNGISGFRFTHYTPFMYSHP